MAICPFSTELLVLALDQNLSGKSATSSPMRCADRNSDCSSLRSVRPIIDTFVPNLPNSILQHNKVFSASHSEAPHEGDHLSNGPERIRAGLSNNKDRSNRGYRPTVLSKASPSGLRIAPKGREVESLRNHVPRLAFNSRFLSSGAFKLVGGVSKF